MKTASFLFAFVFVLLCGLSCTPKSSTKPSKSDSKTYKVGLTTFQNSKTLMPVLEMAKVAKKPVFVDFHAKWCGPCKMMDQHVFTNDATAKVLNGKFVSLKVDTDEQSGADIAGIYEVTALPTLIFMDASGKVLVRSVGGIDAQSFNDLAQQALSKM
jgi:thiol:disulfide interchange protein